GGGAMIPILRDLQAIPLLIADDVVVGETTMYCDYIFPDLSYMERWGNPHDNPQPSTKNSLIRQPIASPIPETVRVFGEEMPCSMEAVMLALAEKLGLPGHGKDGFGPGLPFTRPEEFFLKMVANVAAGDKPGDAVREADDAELSLFRKARRHLPRSVFDEAKWVRAAGAANWRRVVTVLNRGGRFEPFSKAYDGDYMAHKFGKPFHLYVERVAKAKNSITGERFDGLPRYEPPLNSDGAPVEDRDYPFHLITFKEASGGHSRTIPTYWSNIALLPENFVLMNKGDARRLGLRDGQVVKLISRTNGDGVWPLGDRKSRMVGGKVRAVEGIRPGVLAVSWHYGHWAYGAEDIVVDGRLVKGDPRRGKGLCANAVMLLDGYTRTACLTDPIGGSASFFDTRVRVVKGG
ncbi:MAG: molybdopterin dinucleotide binding domain-containing protein, partial [Nitrospinota bacterium]